MVESPWTRGHIDGGQSPLVPAVITHRGSLWCLWSDFSGVLFYSVGNDEAFCPRVRFPAFPGYGIPEFPVMVEMLGVLHAVVVYSSGAMMHFSFDDESREWSARAQLTMPTEFSTINAVVLVAFRNQMFLIFVKDKKLSYSTWTSNTHDDGGVWSLPHSVNGIGKVSSISTAFELRGELQVLYCSEDKSGDISGLSYSPSNGNWKSSNDALGGRALAGVSTISYGQSIFMAFSMEKRSDNDSEAFYLTELNGGKWGPIEAIGGHTSKERPQLAVLNGRIHCIFNDGDHRKGFRWFSKNLLDYSLSDWMADLPDETLMSDITIPGTHDSCAKSNIPYVRTQNLSITEQLEAGIRFLDLRLRVHDDGELYLYHGGIPLNWPLYLKFDKVMSDVFTFMDKHGEPSETVIVSINNDDYASKKPAFVFYNAVQKHIDEAPRDSNGQERWITARTTVTLGQARGKAILLRRYRADPALPTASRIGLDLSRWWNNHPDFTLLTPDRVVVTIQDKWHYTDFIPLADLVDDKFGHVSNLLSKAAVGPPTQWFFNFTSAVGDPAQNGEIAECRWVAVGARSNITGEFVPGVNVVTRRDYPWATRTRYGVVAMDFAELPKESDLIAWLVGTNF
jgi:1-phosphatidylinositol phosphodiesterase